MTSEQRIEQQKIINELNEEFKDHFHIKSITHLNEFSLQCFINEEMLRVMKTRISKQ